MTGAPIPGPVGAPDGAVAVLRRLTQPRERVRALPGESCQLCGEPISQPHQHLADVAQRQLLCACRGCYLLFTAPGAGARKLRAVGEQVRRPSDFAFSQAQWEDLSVPVDLVFFLRQSGVAESAASSPTSDGQLVVCYPSPAGATESELDFGAWDKIAAANPALAGVEPDIEAVLVRRHGPDRFSCLIVPIDRCYELVGLVRKHWVGFHGGDEVWRRIEDYFAELERVAR